MKTQVTPDGGVKLTRPLYSYEDKIQHLTGLFIDQQIDFAGESMYRKLLVEHAKDPLQLFVVYDAHNNKDDVLRKFPELVNVQKLFFVTMQSLSGSVMRLRNKLERLDTELVGKPKLSLWLNATTALHFWEGKWNFTSLSVRYCVGACDAVYATMRVGRFLEGANSLQLHGPETTE